MIEFEIKNRFTDSVQFVAKINCDKDAVFSLKMGLSVKAAIKICADLSGADLSGADLSDADLSGADLSDADLRDADLRDADLSGADLRDADLRDANLRDANLRGANLRDADLSDANLRDANLRDANLRGANLRGANLRDANLSGADLSDADLSDANLRGAPIIENIHQKIADAVCVEGALNMKRWHTCETTHCRAGWVVSIAGQEGKKLEDKIGTSAAASAIYMVSDPSLDRIPDFHCDNETAMADILAMAKKEKMKGL